MPRKQPPLTHKGEPKQRTPGGLEIPIVTRGKFFADLDKVVKKAPKPEPSESDQETR